MVCLWAFLVWSSGPGIVIRPFVSSRLLLVVANPAVWQKNPLNRFFILLYTWFHPPPLVFGVILMANIGFVSSWMQTFRCDRLYKPAKFRAFTPNIEVQQLIYQQLFVLLAERTLKKMAATSFIMVTVTSSWCPTLELLFFSPLFTPDLIGGSARRLNDPEFPTRTFKCCTNPNHIFAKFCHVPFVYFNH